MSSYRYDPFPYRPPSEFGDGGRIHPVVIVGAGPVGLAAAIDLALHGVRSIVLDDNNVVSRGSRAICWAKRTLEILDRLGVGERFLQKGVTWKIGRVFHRDELLYSFDLLPEDGHKMPAFVNLQQYYAEEYLVARCQELGDMIELRWKHKFVGLEQDASQVRIDVETADGGYALRTEWLIAADGARSSVRETLGLELHGRSFDERFLIVDVRWPGAPSERRFWFHPTFDASESILMHRQPDGISRIDFQLDKSMDAKVELQPERVRERVTRVLGEDAAFDVEWCSLYTFRCVRLERFVHDRVIFVGDSAHVVSPFGARGGNGGLQDVDNLCWKLARVCRGEGPVSLLHSYDEERGHGCDENILNSSRTTRFMTPTTPVERAFRDGTLALAKSFPFARKLVNSGRLSAPCVLGAASHVTPDVAEFEADMVPGAACLDAPVIAAGGVESWLLQFVGQQFCVLVFGRDDADVDFYRGLLRSAGIPVRAIVLLPASAAARTEGALTDCSGLARSRYGGEVGVTYLIRPDQHVAARFPDFDPPAVREAFHRAIHGVNV